VLPFLGGEPFDTLENFRVGDMRLCGLHRSNQLGLQVWEQERASDDAERLLVIVLDPNRVELVRKLERHLSHGNRVQHGHS